MTTPSFVEKADAIIHAFQLKLSWNAKARQKIYKMIGTFVGDGIPIQVAVEEINDRLIAKKDPRALITKAVLADMRGQSGVALRFGQAMRPWCPSMEAIAIDSGEIGGDLEHGLKMASRLTGVKQRIRNTIISQLFQPTILVMGFLAFLVLLKMMILPGMADVLPRDRWPAIAANLGFVADAVVPIMVAFSGCFAFLTTVFILTRDVWAGRGRLFFDTWIFPWTLHRQVSGSILLTCFAALLRAGIDLNSILKRIEENATPWELKHLQIMGLRRRAGLAEGDSVATPLFDDESRWMISVYGQRTNFSEALEGLSEEIVEQMLGRITVATGVISILARIGVAILIMWVVFSLIYISLEAKNMAGG